MTHRDDLLAACAEKVGDVHQLLVAADWMAENDDPVWENCLRWMAKWEKWPLLLSPTEGNKDIHKDPPLWEWTCFGGLCGPTFNCGTHHALPRTLCKAIDFWEWRCFTTWVEAVGALATALTVTGAVECVGDPTQCEEQAAETARQLRASGLLPEGTE